VGKTTGGPKREPLINNPLFLMADEPTGNLDSIIRKRLQYIIKRAKEEEGLSLLISKPMIRTSPNVPICIIPEWRGPVCLD